MKNKIEYNYYDFILPAFENEEKYTFIVAARRIGKTYASFQWVLENLLYKESKGLWVDTTQTNLATYRSDHMKEILKEEYQNIRIDNQKNIIYFKNGSRLDMRSAERPELLEGFEYDWVVLNEAGIILKKKGLWENSIMPMCKNAKVKIVGTPKGKNKYYELTESFKNNPNSKKFVFTVYDCPRYTPEEIEQIKNSTDINTFRSEYLGEFLDTYENSLVKQEWVQYYTTLPELKKVSIHNDLTHTGKTTSDYFCWCLVGEGVDNNYYVIDWVLEKTDPLTQSHICINKYMQYKNKNIVKMTYDAVSNDGWGDWTKKEAKNKDISLPLEPFKAKGDKITNLTSVLPHLVSKRVFFNKEHSQLQLAMSQLLAFPNKLIHDDFVDAFVTSLNNLANKANTLTDEEAEFWGLNKK